MGNGCRRALTPEQTPPPCLLLRGEGRHGQGSSLRSHRLIYCHCVGHISMRATHRPAAFYKPAWHLRGAVRPNEVTSKVGIVCTEMMTLLTGNTGHSGRGWGPAKGLITP